MVVANARKRSLNVVTQLGKRGLCDLQPPLRSIPNEREQRFHSRGPRVDARFLIKWVAAEHALVELRRRVARNRHEVKERNALG